MGHAVGDSALKIVAERLRRNCRTTDFVARIGGDEFAILFDVHRSDMRSAATRLQGVMNRVFQTIVLQNDPVTLGAAVGLSFQKRDEDSPATLLKRADECMYLAKSSGERVKVVGDAREGESH